MLIGPGRTGLLKEMPEVPCGLSSIQCKKGNRVLVSLCSSILVAKLNVSTCMLLPSNRSYSWPILLNAGLLSLMLAWVAYDWDSVMHIFCTAVGIVLNSLCGGVSLLKGRKHLALAYGIAVLVFAGLWLFILHFGRALD
jgi:hypothetical protein